MTASRAAALLAISAALAWASPLLLAPYFPGLDLPWHAAVAEILRHPPAAQTERFLGYFATDWRFASYVTMYWLVAALGRCTADTALAMQLVLGLYVVGFTLASARLATGFGRSPWLALLAAPAAFSQVLEFGFLTYALSYPLTLLLWAEVARCLAAPGGRGGRLALVFLWMALCALSHPFAAAVAAAGGLCIALCHGQGRPGPVLAVAAALVLALAPAILGLLALGGASAAGRAGPAWRLLLAQEFTGPVESLLVAPARLFGFLALPWRFALVPLAALCAALVPGPVRSGQVPGRNGAVAALLLVTGIYLLTPYTFHWPQRWFAAQPRLLPLCWVLLLIAVPPLSGADRAPSPWQRGLGAAGALACSVLALALLYRALLPHAREARDLRAVLARAAPGQRTLGLIETPRAGERAPASPWRHAAAYALVERGGFVSHLPVARPSAGNAGVLVPVRLAAAAPPLPPEPPLGQPRTFRFAVHGAGWDQFLIRDAQPAQPWDYFREHRGAVELRARAGLWRLYARRRLTSAPVPAARAVPAPGPGPAGSPPPGSAARWRATHPDR